MWFRHIAFVIVGLKLPTCVITEKKQIVSRKKSTKTSSGFLCHMLLDSKKRSVSGQRPCHPPQCAQVFPRSQEVIVFPLLKKSPSVQRRVISLTWGGQPMPTCSSAVGVAEGEKTLCRAGVVQSEGAEQLCLEKPSWRGRQVSGPKK